MSELENEELQKIRAGLNEVKQIVFQLEQRVRILEEKERRTQVTQKSKEAIPVIPPLTVEKPPKTVVSKPAVREESAMEKKEQELRGRAPRFLQSMPDEEKKKRTQKTGASVKLLQDMDHEERKVKKEGGWRFNFSQKMVLPSIFAGMILLGVVWLLSVLNSYGFITPLLKVAFFYAASAGTFYAARKKVSQALFRQLLYGLAFAVAILTTGAGVLLYQMIPMIAGFGVTVLILLAGFWTSREEKSEILTIGMLITSLLLPHLMIIENLSMAIIFLYAIITVGFVSWFDKENHFRVSEVVKNGFTFLIILQGYRLIGIWQLFPLALGLVLLASNLFAASWTDRLGRILFSINSGIAVAGLLLMVNLRDGALWKNALIWIVLLGLTYFLRKQRFFQDIYFLFSSFFLALVILNWQGASDLAYLIGLVALTVGYFVMAGFYRLKITAASMTIAFILLEWISWLLELKEKAAIGVGLAVMLATIFYFKKKIVLLDWNLPTLLITGHLWFSMCLYLQINNQILGILTVLISIAVFQWLLRPLDKVYVVYALVVQIFTIYAVLPGVMQNYSTSTWIVLLYALFFSGYLFFAADQKWNLSFYTISGGYIWLFVIRIFDLPLFVGLIYLLMGLMTLVGLYMKRDRFVLPELFYTGACIGLDVLVLLYSFFRAHNSISAALIVISLSVFVLTEFQVIRQKEVALLQNYSMGLMILGYLLFVLFLPSDTSYGMIVIAMLLYLMSLGAFVYLGRVYYYGAAKEWRLPSVQKVLLGVPLLWRTISIVNELTGSSDFTRRLSLSVALFVYGLIVLWYGNWRKRPQFERYSFLIILFSIAKIILYDFYGVPVIIRGSLFLVLGIIGFATIWKLQKK